MANQGRCGVGRIFARCGESPIHVCQYCGTDFCEVHTHHVEGHEAVCKRDPCVAKHEDLQVHLIYRRRSDQKNGAGLCGVEPCTERPEAQCSLCQGAFCGVHLMQRKYTVRDDRGPIERMVSACPRCWERRKIWSKTR